LSSWQCYAATGGISLFEGHLNVEAVPCYTAGIEEGPSSKKENYGSGSCKEEGSVCTDLSMPGWLEEEGKPAES
jgi:hypothetical protein